MNVFICLFVRLFQWSDQGDAIAPRSNLTLIFLPPHLQPGFHTVKCTRIQNDARRAHNQARPSLNKKQRFAELNFRDRQPFFSSICCGFLWLRKISFICENEITCSSLSFVVRVYRSSECVERVIFHTPTERLMTFCSSSSWKMEERLRAVRHKPIKPA